ncbi:cholesterol esterase, partial [Modicella reniformis]
MCSEVWLCNLDEERNLAFVLAEAGYDVWLGNARGNKYSLKHMYLKPHEDKFWDFSMDELALFDMPDTIDHWFQIIRTQLFQMYDDVQPRVPYLSSTRGHCPHPFPTNQITTPIAIFYGGNDTLVDIGSLRLALPELVGIWEVPNYEHLDFLWAEGLEEHVYPHVLQLLENHSFNGHVSSNEAKMKPALNDASESTRQIHRRHVDGQEQQL